MRDVVDALHVIAWVLGISGFLVVISLFSISSWLGRIFNRLDRIPRKLDQHP